MRNSTLPVVALVLLALCTAGAGAIQYPFPLLAGPVGGTGSTAADAGDYARAEQFLPQSVIPRLYNVSAEPHWIGDGPVFWYEQTSRGETAYVLVDPLNRTQRPVFDHAGLAAALSGATGRAVNASGLSLTAVDVRRDGTVRFASSNRTW